MLSFREVREVRVVVAAVAVEVNCLVVLPRLGVVVAVGVGGIAVIPAAAVIPATAAARLVQQHILEGP
jgi:hypothetical protein